VGFVIPPLCTMRILNPIETNCFVLKNGLQILRIQKVGITNPNNQSETFYKQ